MTEAITRSQPARSVVTTHALKPSATDYSLLSVVLLRKEKEGAGAQTHTNPLHPKKTKEKAKGSMAKRERRNALTHGAKGGKTLKCAYFLPGRNGTLREKRTLRISTGRARTVRLWMAQAMQ